MRWVAAVSLAAVAITAHADEAALRATYAQRQPQLLNNAYGQALAIDSTQVDDGLQGDVYAVLDHPFARVSEVLRAPAQWCEVMLLPFNTKDCRAQARGEGTALHVWIGRKYDQPLQDAHQLTFSFQPLARHADYFATRLQADAGPLGTRDYQIMVEVMALDARHSFLHLRYAYRYGVAARLALQAYLATVAADKVGFTVTGRDARGQAQYIGGIRGAIERNAMRYYLAIDAYLDAGSQPAAARTEYSIQAWFTATERYARQLHEMDRNTYVQLKRQEFERQQVASLPP